MVTFLGMTLEVISRPFTTGLLKLCNFVAFLYLLLDMVSLMQTLCRTGTCTCISRLQKKFDRTFPVTFRSFQGHLS